MRGYFVSVRGLTLRLSEALRRGLLRPDELEAIFAPTALERELLSWSTARAREDVMLRAAHARASLRRGIPRRKGAA